MTIPEPPICQNPFCNSRVDVQYVQYGCEEWRWTCPVCIDAAHRLTQALCWQLDNLKAEGRRRRLAQAA